MIQLVMPLPSIKLMSMPLHRSDPEWEWSLYMPLLLCANNIEHHGKAVLYYSSVFALVHAQEKTSCSGKYINLQLLGSNNHLWSVAGGRCCGGWISSIITVETNCLYNYRQHNIFMTQDIYCPQLETVLCWELIIIAFSLSHCLTQQQAWNLTPPSVHFMWQLIILTR